MNKFTILVEIENLKLKVENLYNEFITEKNNNR